MITLTNKVIIGDERTLFPRTVSISETYGILSPISVVQNDISLPVASISLIDAGVPYKPPADSQLRVRMRKPNGKYVYNPCLGMDSAGVVYFEFTSQMCASHGEGWCNIEITHSDLNVKNSQKIPVTVTQNAVSREEEHSSDEWNTIDEVLSEMEDMRDEVAENTAIVVESAKNIKESEENAKASELAAAASAAAAKQSELNSSQSESAALQYKVEAKGSSDSAKSYAVGGTGTRPGEDTDNAKYYAELAESTSNVAGHNSSPQAHPDIRSMIATLWDAVFTNITGNPFTVAFTSLDGITVTAGIWNTAGARLEC